MADTLIQLLYKILMRYFETFLYYIIISLLASNGGVLATIPPQLQFAVPACAQFCLLEIIERDFAAFCPEPITLDCLCSTYGGGGLVIGESELLDRARVSLG